MNGVLLTANTYPSLFDVAWKEFQKQQYEFTRVQEQLKIDREKFQNESRIMQNIVERTDVIQLNVGGEQVITSRATLTVIPNSTLAMMFNGRWEHKLSNDREGNIFLDYNPMLFRHLLEQLRR